MSIVKQSEEKDLVNRDLISNATLDEIDVSRPGEASVQ